MPHSHCPSLQFLPLPRPPAGPGCLHPPLPTPCPEREGRGDRRRRGTGTGGVCGSSHAAPHTGCSPTISWRRSGALVSRKVLGQGQLETSQGSHLPWGEPSEGPGLGLWASPISAPQPFRAFPEGWPTLFTCGPPATLIFQGFLQEAPESPLPTLLSWAWHGEWVGCPGEPQKTPTVPCVPRLSPCGSGASPGVSWRDQTQIPFPRGPSWARPARHRRWGGF